MNKLSVANEWFLCTIFPGRRQTTWLRVTQEQEDRIYDNFKKVVIGIAICTALSGMFFTYRLGEYMQTRRMVENNWHPVILQQIKSN